MPLPTATLHNSDESGTECTKLENKLIVDVTADYEPGTGTTGLNLEEKMMQCNSSHDDKLLTYFVFLSPPTNRPTRFVPLVP